ncbi:hypothetical protein EDC01DRAFT_661411 [Geopyxis carbonaria]|nr:hypothetical protein EDC01DRAFT_661411 [Geopyxis carbonaria]
MCLGNSHLHFICRQPWFALSQFRSRLLNPLNPRNATQFHLPPSVSSPSHLTVSTVHQLSAPSLQYTHSLRRLCACTLHPMPRNRPNSSDKHASTPASSSALAVPSRSGDTTIPWPRGASFAVVIYNPARTARPVTPTPIPKPSRRLDRGTRTIRRTSSRLTSTKSINTTDTARIESEFYSRGVYVNGVHVDGASMDAERDAGLQEVVGDEEEVFWEECAAAKEADRELEAGSGRLDGDGGDGGGSAGSASVGSVAEPDWRSEIIRAMGLMRAELGLGGGDEEGEEMEAEEDVKVEEE